MQACKLDSAQLINELQCGSTINQALNDHRRADFSLILAMLSEDCQETAVTEILPESTTMDDELRLQFGLPAPQLLDGQSTTYDHSAKIAEQFHAGGLSAAKLQQCLVPDALTYHPDDTLGLPEDVYHNLSGHTRRHLREPVKPTQLSFGLLEQLITTRRRSQMIASTDV